MAVSTSGCINSQDRNAEARFSALAQHICTPPQLVEEAALERGGYARAHIDTARHADCISHHHNDSEKCCTPAADRGRGVGRRRLCAGALSCKTQIWHEESR